jgi:hypothetical protein
VGIDMGSTGFFCSVQLADGFLLIVSVWRDFVEDMLLVLSAPENLHGPLRVNIDSDTFTGDSIRGPNFIVDFVPCDGFNDPICRTPIFDDDIRDEDLLGWQISPLCVLDS